MLWYEFDFDGKFRHGKLLIKEKYPHTIITERYRFCCFTAYFCSKWKLEVNTSKSKVLVFNSNGKSFLNHFRYKNQIIETVNQYCYLGFTLKCNGNFNLGISVLMEKARKAYFKIKKAIGLNNPCKLLEKLFDCLVKPILLYGCEVWGLEFALMNRDSEPYELLHSKFMKEILGVHCKTSNVGCRSELGRLPLSNHILISSAKFLDHLIKDDQSLAHDILLETWRSNSWSKNIVSYFNKLGFPFMNQLLPFLSIKPFIKSIIQRTSDQCIQDQLSKVVESEKLLWYRKLYKFQRAPYVDLITSKLDRSMLAKMRLSAHNLEIERGRYLNIERERRLCQVCNANVIENENHFLWDCMKYDKDRKLFIDKVSSHFSNFHLIPNDLKSAKLMNANSTKFVKMLSRYIARLMEIRNDSIK